MEGSTHCSFLLFSRTERLARLWGMAVGGEEDERKQKVMMIGGTCERTIGPVPDTSVFCFRLSCSTFGRGGRSVTKSSSLMRSYHCASLIFGNRFSQFEQYIMLPMASIHPVGYQDLRL